MEYYWPDSFFPWVTPISNLVKLVLSVRPKLQFVHTVIDRISPCAKYYLQSASIDYRIIISSSFLSLQMRIEYVAIANCLDQYFCKAEIYLERSRPFLVGAFSFKGKKPDYYSD